MREIKKILLPVDFSEGSKIAAFYALQQARIFSAELHVMHAISFPVLAGFHGEPMMNAQIIEAAETTSLEELIKFTKDLGNEVKTSYYLEKTTNSVAQSICDRAKNQNIDLIVIAKHGRKGLQKFLLGSVTEKVIRIAECPVLTVPVTDK